MVDDRGPVVLHPDGDTAPMDEARAGDQLVITWHGLRIACLVLSVRPVVEPMTELPRP